MKSKILIISFVTLLSQYINGQTKTVEKKSTTTKSTTKQVKFFELGSKTDTEYHGEWYPSEIVKLQGDSFFIHYENYDNSWDEWVKKERLRFRQAVAKTNKTSVKQTTSSSTASTNDIVFSNVCDYTVTFYVSYNGVTESFSVAKKSTYNKKVYNGSKIEQKANGYGNIDKGTIESYQSVITSSCQ